MEEVSKTISTYWLPARLLMSRLLAFAADQPPRHLPGGAPFMIRPPEVFVYDISQCKAGSVWSKEADIWALGCVVRTYCIGCVPGLLFNALGEW